MGRVDDIKLEIKESISQFAKLGPTDDKAHTELIGGLLKMVDDEWDFRKLFLMRQSMNEMISMELTGKAEAPFVLQKKDGTNVTVKNLDEARTLAK